jgi:hypothetical protein
MFKFFLNRIISIKNYLEYIFYGKIYSSNGVVSVEQVQSETKGFTYRWICEEYYVLNSISLPEAFKLETNLNMKKFYLFSIKKGRIITDLGPNLAVYDCNNRMIEEACFTYVKNENGHFVHGESKNNIYFDSYKIPKPIYYDARVFSLLTGGGQNFNIYHWFFDSLARLYAIKDEIHLIDFFLVPEYIQHYQIESLRCLGIESHKVISSVINKHIIAKELLTTSHPRTATFSNRVEISNFLRIKFKDLYFNKINPEKQYPKKFYISRKDAPRRMVLNEEVIMACLKEILIPSITISDYTFYEIIHLFRNADIIVSTHSAALSNLLFCKSGMKVIEYFPDTGFLPYYEELCLNLGLCYFPVIEQIPLNTKMQSRYDLQNEKYITINMDTFMNAISLVNESSIN